MFNWKLNRRLAAVALGGGMALAGTIPAHAGLLSLTTATVQATVTQTCKTVAVFASTGPTLTVTIAGTPHTIDVSGIVAKQVKVCVSATAGTQVDVLAAADLSNPLCPVALANVVVKQAQAVSVQVTGVNVLGLPIGVDSGDLVGPINGGVPLVIATCVV